DAAAGGDLEGLAGLGVHLVDAADVFLLAAGGVDHAGALGELAGVDAHVGQVAVAVADDLEDQGAEGGVLAVRAAELDLLIARVGTLDLGNLRGVREIVDHAVQQALHADVLEGGAAEDDRAL